MKKSVLISCLVMAAFAGFACDDSQTVEKNDGDDTLGSYKISVHIDDVEKGNVDIKDMESKIQTVTVNNEDSKALAISDIIQKVNGVSDADLDAYLAKYKCEYESGDDGFRPSSKGEKCAMLSCSYTKQSYVNVESHGVFYADDAPQKNGCYRVKNVSKVLMYEIDEEAVEIWIYRDDEVLAKVDASKLETTTVGGKKAVTLENLIKGADSEIDLTKYLCDFRTDDSDKLISVDKSCAPTNCADMTDSVIILENRKMDDNKAENACYEVDHVKAVYVSTIRDHYDPYNVEIVVNGEKFATVDLSTLVDKAVTANSVASVSVADVFAAAGVDIDLAKAQCEAASLGGEKDYRPSNKDTCSTLLSCDELAKATIALVDPHKLTANQPQNCYNVTAVNTIEITTSNAPQKPELEIESYVIDVVLDGEALASVDLKDMKDAVKTVDDKNVVYFNDIIEAAATKANKTVNLADTYCDYIGSDGWKPADAGSGDCKVIRSCSYSSAAYIDVADTEKHKLFTTDDGPTCYGVKNIKTVKVYTTDPNEA
ncbi:MAG: hypothetical protein IJU23_14935 [Proteobacteria bacterium]|nr:hypothetical protein [Pseudomonadota bacterium]